jgi:peptide deformylase
MSELVCELVKETDPFLREVSERFDFDNPQVDSEKLEKQLIENMIHYEGYGLAANQIGIPVKAFAMLLDRRPIVVFNPEIRDWSDETTYIREGCLSFPGLWIAIKRPYGVTARFQLSTGEEQQGNFVDLSARIFQHETEHMNGELFIDKVSNFKLKSAKDKRKIYLRKFKRKKKKNDTK